MRLIDRRLGLLFCFFVLLFSVALARAAWLQGVRGGELRADAHSQQVTTVTVPGERGRVLDRNGKVLAVSEDAADRDRHARTRWRTRRGRLSGSPRSSRRAAGGARGGAVRPRVRLRVPRPQGRPRRGRARSSELEHPRHLDTIPDSRRLYPQGELASQVIGAVGTENEGLTGLEQAEDEILGGADGEQEVVHDARGEPDPLRHGEARPASATTSA